MTRLLVVVAIGFVVAILTASFLFEWKGTRPVLVAKRALPAGVRITEEMVEVKEIPRAAILPGALFGPEQAEGQVIVMARAKGDQITSDMIGGEALSEISRGLEKDYRTIGIHVDQATGLLGVLRRGDKVMAIAVFKPHELGMGGERDIVSAICAHGLRVSLVPQLFRYEEVLPTEEEGIFSPVRTTYQAQRESVILLDVPLKKVKLSEELEVSLPELLALLDDCCKIHLVLEPVEADYSVITETVGVRLSSVFEVISEGISPFSPEEPSEK